MCRLALVARIGHVPVTKRRRGGEKKPNDFYLQNGGCATGAERG